MKITATSVEQYIKKVPASHRSNVIKLRELFKTHLPDGFEEQILYDMISFVVPLSRYPDGYLKRKTPLPFVSIGAQKHHIGLYHSGLYMDQSLHTWFDEAYKKAMGTSKSMGKSCIRLPLKKELPESLFIELAKSMTVTEYITLYEGVQKKKD